MHGVLLIIFLGDQWLKPANTSFEGLQFMLLNSLSTAQIQGISRKLTPDFVMATILSAMAVGCLCARSLHYQFYAYIAWSSPYLLWKSGLRPALVYTIWVAQEWAWNEYPSTDVSSLVVVGCLTATVIASYHAISRTKGVEMAAEEERKRVD